MNNKVKAIAKGLALGVLWPSAAVYVVSKKTSKWLGDVAHESLDTAVDWSNQAEAGIQEAKLAVEIRWAKKTEVPVAVAARSVGAAAASDPNVTGKRNRLYWWGPKEVTMKDTQKSTFGKKAKQLTQGYWQEVTLLLALMVIARTLGYFISPLAGITFVAITVPCYLLAMSEFSKSPTAEAVSTRN